MKKITQKLTKSIWKISFIAFTFLFSLSIYAQDLALQGVLDLTVPSGGNDGKALHLVANTDISDLSIYGIGVANNGGGSDDQEYSFPSVSLFAGDNIMLARSPEAMGTYLDVSADQIFEVGSFLGGNGDDAIELFLNGEVIETYGDISWDEGGSDLEWNYLDSWGYKVNGVWTYGGVDCDDNSETTATSDCPYPYTGVYTLGTEIQTETFDVTFSVNTANIVGGVSENGMYLGGGVLGGSDEYAMSDDDGDGTWTVTIALNEGTEGNYTFFNGPNSSNDWNSGENLSGLSCADPENYDDRILAPITGDSTLLHCFNSCDTDGSCPTDFLTIEFNVNTANIDVGENGMFVGGGFVGNANALPMSDDDGDGIWTASLEVLPGQGGNFTYLNSPVDGGDYSAKENIAGQECADSENYNDRLLPPVTEDIILTHCFGTCDTDGTCSDPDPTDVTFNVDMSQYGLAEGDTVHVNGEFTGWCGSCGNEMNDEDGDGFYTITMDINPGTYFWKFSVNAWEDQEQFNGTELVDGCTVQNNDNVDRQIVVGTDDMEVTYGWNSCEAGLSVSDNTLLDMTIYPNPSNGSYVTIQTPVNGVKYVEVFDITGKRLINTSLNVDTLNVSSISTGMYFVKVTIEGQSKTSKLIIR